jgi:hypothetical protein
LKTQVPVAATLQVSKNMTLLPAGKIGIAKPLVVKVLTDNDAGQDAPPPAAQDRVEQFRPDEGASFTTAELAQAGPALLTVI